jgi:subtilisin family serine protease
MLFYSRDSSLDQDCADAIADGIIMVGAAGNYYMYNERAGGVLYDNYLKYIFNYYYMRGPSPTAATGVIHVSAVDSTVAEQKVNFSNAGPRTDIFSPGSAIVSSMNSSDTTDPRNASYYKGNMSGTSMASPQVTGVLACALETYPNMTPAQALTYIQTYANSGVLSDSTFVVDYGSISYINYNLLYNGPNKYITYRKERGEQYQVYPKRDYNIRPTTGRTYPRPRIRRFG